MIAFNALQYTVPQFLVGCSFHERTDLLYRSTSTNSFFAARNAFLDHTSVGRPYHSSMAFLFLPIGQGALKVKCHHFSDASDTLLSVPCRYTAAGTMHENRAYTPPPLLRETVGCLAKTGEIT